MDLSVIPLTLPRIAGRGRQTGSNFAIVGPYFYADWRLVMKIRRSRNRKRTVTQDMINRAVASSTAIETGEPVAVIEEKLKSKNSKFQSLTLAP
jgi:hypothetical protein